MRKKLLIFTIILFQAIFFATNVLAGNPEISEENLQKAEAAYKRGVNLVKSKSYESAIELFNKALSYNPEMTDAYYNIAAIYIAQKKYDEAYSIYTKIIALNPYDYDSVLQAAKISYNRKNYALTMKYIKYIPDDYEYYYIAEQLYKDANEMYKTQKDKVERAKVTTSNKNKRVLIDKFNSPAGMAVDSEGNMFVACYSDNSIVKIDKNKQRTNYVKDYLLDGPIGIAIDNYDNIYVANYEANNILRITKNGNVSVFMDKVAKPYFLYIKDDILYISEQGNDVVLTYSLTASR